MIITTTPYRISFFGGGTDYHEWYEKNGGAVLSTTINHYCNIHARFLPPFFDHRYRIVWSQIETPESRSDIQHPSVRGALEHLGIDEGLEIHHFGDLPARAGLGSSSSFSVGILNALHHLKNSIPTKHELAKNAVYLEREILKENVGVQDQIAAAYGGFNHIEISNDGNFHVTPVPVPHARLKQLEEHMLLVFTGVSRTASDIAAKKIKALDQKKNVLMDMSRQVETAIDILVNGRNIREFGELLHTGWQLKRSIVPDISTSLIDDLYARARSAGAIGGKLLGAGGGGFMLLFIEPDKREDLIRTLENVLPIPFEFETRGAQISVL